ncbi:MAG: methionine--tRNA ligase [Chloroflexi bacterium]|nr:methionine--tRNA ligase [Chloroflexota bacterium]
MADYIHVSVAWPYANGDLHIGHLAGNLLPGDIFARYHRLKGSHVLMVSGSDSHGTPVILTAQEEGATPRETFEKYHRRFLETQRAIGITFDLYTHTDTENHHRISQDFFLQLHERGYLYQETQELFFDEVAERFLPDRFVEGTCYICGFEDARGDQCDNCGNLMETVRLINPRSKLTGATPVIRETTHYFLDLPKLQEELLAYLGDDKDHWRANVLNFSRELAADLKGRPITRDIDWGISVPLDGWREKKLYVWFEAVIGYFSASLEWAQSTSNPEAWRQWWYNPEARIYNFLGKDNIPFHTIIWPAELIGVSGIYTDDDTALNLPYDVPANEFLRLDNDQFSKSRRHAVWLHEALEAYDPDAIRYYITANMPEVRDSNFTWEDFVTRNNSELVGWWGNLANRVLKFANKYWDGHVPDAGELGEEDRALLATIEAGFETVGAHLDAVKLRRGLDEAMALVREVNVYLDKAPWFGVVKEDKQAAARTVYTALQAITHLAVMLAPYLPFSSQKLLAMLGFDDAQLFGEQQIVTYDEETRSHDALIYDGSAANVAWGPLHLPPGQRMQPPAALYDKLDRESVLERELV